MPTTKKPVKATATDEPADGFTSEERSAIKERAKELRTAKGRKGKADAQDELSALLAKIAEMEPSDRAMAERIHEVVTASAPELTPKLWYGMPAYAKSGKVVCFFQPAWKFKTRYATFGFNDSARIDDGQMWPTAYALTEVNDAVAERIGELVSRAMS